MTSFLTSLLLVVMSFWLLFDCDVISFVACKLLVCLCCDLFLFLDADWLLLVSMATDDVIVLSSPWSLSLLMVITDPPPLTGESDIRILLPW